MIDSNEESGFTLLEVLVALSILTFGLVAYNHVMTNSLSGLGNVKAREAMLRHGWSELELARILNGAQREKSGRYTNGMTWSTRSEYMRVISNSKAATLRPSWIVFEVKSSSGKEVLKLRTVTIDRQQ